MKEFVELYSNLYLSENVGMVREVLANNNIVPVSKWVERAALDALGKDNAFLLKRIEPGNKQELMRKQELIWRLIAWKAGHLRSEPEGSSAHSELFTCRDEANHMVYLWDGATVRGQKIGKKRGETLSEEERKGRISDYISKICFLLSSGEASGRSGDRRIFSQEKDKNSAFKSDYINLSELECANIGPVYIIALLYFFSNGRYPIYDQFAHIAAKAIYLDANPGEIHIGNPPAKTEREKVFLMYNEYCWLLEQLFGTKEIGRSEDQALWVYGHSKVKYGGEIRHIRSEKSDGKYGILDFLK